LPAVDLQIAMRDDAVAPKATAVLGAAQRAVESTKPWVSLVGAAVAGVEPSANSAAQAATEADTGRNRCEMGIVFHRSTTGAPSASADTESVPIR
jgi:hypothetical protein